MMQIEKIPEKIWERGRKRYEGSRQLLRGVSNFSLFVFQAFQSLTHINRGHFGPFLDVVIKQVKFTGLQAFRIIGFISILIGGLTIMNALPALEGVGRKQLISSILIFVIVREIGPLITGIVIIVRSGSAITAELATQKLNKEIDALELHGIDPYQYIVLPRLFGGAIATLTLLIYFDGIAFIGGYLVAEMLNVDINPREFFGDVLGALTLGDIFTSVFKGIVFGLIIPLVCTYHGFLPTKLFEVPIFVSRAVVRSLLALFVVGGIISTIFYLA